MAHMAHAATKETCRMNGDAQRSRNPGMTDLIAYRKKTIFYVQSIEKKTGDLFAALCRTQTNTSTTQLLSYAADRFLSITGTIHRILEKWGALVDWYDERAHIAHRQRVSSPSFKLKNHRKDLEPILLLLEPISRLNWHCQAERPNQVAVHMELYQITMLLADSFWLNRKWALSSTTSEMCSNTDDGC
ncbi:hypothetical protein F442_19189 [Phytophthora nicotianae P10297]|uniref:Uncharacterized protein n=1 Tax=Phytophthora nicotianae P10297 TaxID=1317064 RepID=W2YBB5_PHYNI|nr:hypothetical protein F442_19189 [Phytophthora nicotianae P10297]